LASTDDVWPYWRRRDPWFDPVVDLESLSAVQDRLGAAGFTDELVADGVGLRSVTSGRIYPPGALRVIETVRFEGMTDPGDEAILFALATVAGEPVGTRTTPYGPSADADEAAIAVQLRPLPLSEEEIRAHREHDHVAAVFPRRSSAEAAVDELRQLGLGSDRLGVAVHGDQLVSFERDAERDLERDTGIGIGAGVVGGFLAGFALMGLAVPGIGLVGVGGLLALGAASGFGGAFLGGYLGVAAGDRAFTVHEQLAAVALAPGEVVVAVCSHGHPAEVERVFQRHGGRGLATTQT
jgi:hypothetical protein